MKHIKKHIKNIKFKSAFTLFELIIYIGVFGLFFTGLVGILLAADSNNSSAVQKQLLQTYKTFLNNHIQSSFLSSHIIINPSDTNSGNSTELTLGKLNLGTTSINTYYDYQADTLLNKLYYYTGNTPVPFPLTKNSNTAGTLVSGTYYYRIIAYDSSSIPLYVSNELKVVLTSSATINLTWSPSPASGIASYRVYRGIASNTQTSFYSTASTTFADTGSVSYLAGTPNFVNANSSICTDTNCKSISVPESIKLKNFQLTLIKDSLGQNNGIKLHIDLESTFNPSIQGVLDSVYTL